MITPKSCGVWAMFRHDKILAVPVRWEACNAASYHMWRRWSGDDVSTHFQKKKKKYEYCDF